MSGECLSGCHSGWSGSDCQGEKLKFAVFLTALFYFMKLLHMKNVCVCFAFPTS
jgi:hypothetical protein